MMSGDSVCITDEQPRTKDLQFQCHECNKLFYCRRNLSNHMRNHGLECNTCCKGFASQADLDDHLRLQSCDQRHVASNQCTRTFSRKENLRSHLATHLVDVSYAFKSFPRKNLSSTVGYARKSFPKKNRFVTSLSPVDNAIEGPVSKHRYAFKSFTKKNKVVPPGKVAHAQGLSRPQAKRASGGR